MAQKLIDMIGRTFGHLTVIKRAQDRISPSGYKTVMWECQCDCTQKTIVTVDGKSLRAGKIKSCGCSRKINLIGQNFGRLVVLEQIEDYISPQGHHATRWKCQCNCKDHTIIYVNAHALLSGKTQSCGCYQKEQASKSSKKYNTYYLSGDYGIGYTSQGKEFYFDLEDYDLIKDYCWWADDNGYIRAKQISSHNEIMLSRLVMNCPKGLEVDHIYHKLHDNRKSQLRISNSSQQKFNRGIPKNNISGVKGVCWRKDIGKWQAQLFEYGNHHTQLFDNFDDAVRCRQNWEKLYFNEFQFIE